MTAGPSPEGLSRHAALAARTLPDGRTLWLVPQLFNLRLCVTAAGDDAGDSANPETLNL